MANATHADSSTTSSLMPAMNVPQAAGPVLTVAPDQDILLLVNLLIHLLFAAIALTSIVVLSRCTGLRHFNANIFLPYPGHNAKYSIIILLIILFTLSLAEGILTAVTRSHGTDVRLYLPQVVGLFSLVVISVYYHYMEYWNKPRMAWLLFAYWTAALLVSILTFWGLCEEIGADFSTARFDFEILLMVLYFCCLLLELNVIRTKVFGWCYEEGKPSKDMMVKNLCTPDEYNSLPSCLFALHFVRYMLMASKKPIVNLSDLANDSVPHKSCSKYILKEFAETYSIELNKHAQDPSYKPSLWRTFWRIYGRTFSFGLFVLLVGNTLTILRSVLLSPVIQYMDDYMKGAIVTPDSNYVGVREMFGNGYVLLYVMFLLDCFQGVCWINISYMIICAGIRWSTTLRAAVYEKATRLPSVSLFKNDLSTGNMVNYLAVDTTAIQLALPLLPYVISMPYYVAVTVLFMYLQIGIPSLFGLLLVLIIIPIQMKVSSVLTRLHSEQMQIGDQRVKQIDEMLQGMKLLKLYGWEELLSREVKKVRDAEMKKRFTIGKVNVFPTTLSLTLTTSIIYVVCAALAVMSPADFIPTTVFTTVSLISTLITPLVIFAPAFLFNVQSYASTERLSAFLSLDDMEERNDGRPLLTPGYEVSSTEESNTEDKDMGPDFDGSGIVDMDFATSLDETTNLVSAASPPSYSAGLSTLTPEINDNTKTLPDDIAIEIENGQFSWTESGETVYLSSINTCIPAGKLTMIIGLVGSGKSSLVSAILGDMNTTSGRVTFNRNMNKVSYAAQSPWLLNTTVKENILFGEPYNKERYEAVLNACALYPDLSILAAGEMTEIGEKGINMSGGQKQRISVARALYADSDIVILDDPLSALDVHVGSHLMEEGIMKFLLRDKRTVVLVTHQIQYIDNADLLIMMADGKIERQGNLHHISMTDKNLLQEWKREISSVSESDGDTDHGNPALEKTVQPSRPKTGKESDGSLMTTEIGDDVTSSWSAIYLYAKAITFPKVGIIMILFCAMCAAYIMLYLTLAQWAGRISEHHGNETQVQLHHVTMQYLTYFTIEAAVFVFLTVVTGTVLIMSCLRAAESLHGKMLSSVIHSPLRFFDTTPIGRILNRFSHDFAIIDTMLWSTCAITFFFSIQVVSISCVNIITFWPILVVVGSMTMILLIIGKKFTPPTTKLRRLENSTKSPVLATFSETINGLQSIRAYRKDSWIKSKMAENLDNNVKALYVMFGVNKFTNLIAALIASSETWIIMVCLAAVAVKIGLSVSLVGVCFTVTLNLGSCSGWMINRLCELLVYVNSVERVDEYCHLDSEMYSGKQPKDNWPSRGEIKVDNIHVRYAANLDSVLRQVKLEFKSGQKIGICGRTGSGKSSLTLALFRIIDTFKGKIMIDGEDIAGVPLLTLRNRLAIIPQDPVLFCNTIRYNLDPVGKFDDLQLWEALEIAQLKPYIKELPGELDAEVAEGGDNFSQGQKQLFCLARAFLRKSKILVMDEATASVDRETDKVIQEVVATNFVGSTIISIAHRIDTIIDYDKILVLNEGSVAEFDTPQNLLMKPNGAFASMVRDGL